jgi:integrase/recombinase XerD
VVIQSVQRAFRRSGLVVASRGAHALRHTVATDLMRAGVSLKAIADVLGHRSLDTTALYAKVDLPRLRAVARPWPTEVPS